MTAVDVAGELAAIRAGQEKVLEALALDRRMNHLEVEFAALGAEVRAQQRASADAATAAAAAAARRPSWTQVVPAVAAILTMIVTLGGIVIFLATTARPGG